MSAHPCDASVKEVARKAGAVSFEATPVIAANPED
jgi:hypothetical protein